jgi:LysM repeat protein
MRFSFLVSTLLACALAATVLAAALLVGLFPSGPGGVANATPRPSTSFLIPTIAPGTPTPEVTAEPTPTPPPATIDPGQGGTYEVQPGDSLSLIGEKVGVPWQLIAEANGIEGPDYVIVPGQILTIPAIPVPTAGAEFYIVQSGDTITAIAEQFGITPTALADYNNVGDWNSIQVGDILYIPADENATPLPLESTEPT